MENQLFYLQTNSYESWMMMNDFVGFNKSYEKRLFHEISPKLLSSNSKLTPYFIGGQNDKMVPQGLKYMRAIKRR